MVTAFTHKPSLVRIDARNFELSWQKTNKHTDTDTHKQTHRQDRLQYTAPLSLAHSVYMKLKLKSMQILIGRTILITFGHVDDRYIRSGVPFI